MTNYAFIPDCTLPKPTYAVDEVEPITMGTSVYDIGYECRSASGNQVFKFDYTCTCRYMYVLAM